MPKARVRKSKVLILILALIVAILFGTWFYYGQTTTVTTDVNNKCGYTEDGIKVTTQVSKKIVYDEVPSYKVDEYIADQWATGKCIYKASDPYIKN